MLSWLWRIREDEDRHSLYSMSGSSICTFEILGHDLAIVDDSQRGLSRLQSAIRLLKFVSAGGTIRFPGWTLVIILSVFLLGRLPSFLQHYKKGVMKIV